MLLKWKIAANHPPMVRMLTKSKVLQLTHCTQKNSGITAARKIKPTVVTMRAILNPLLMSNL